MNEQYMQWKQMYRPYSGISVSKGTDSPLDSSLFHTPSKPESCVIMATRPSRPLQDTLKYPSPVPKVVPPEQKPTSRVLTSFQNLESLEKKQRLKDEKMRLKEEKQKLREQKAKEREERHAGTLI